MYLNKAMIFGNLTRDPEMKALPSGMQVCSLALATVTEEVEAHKALLRSLTIRLTKTEEANPFRFHDALADLKTRNVIITDEEVVTEGEEVVEGEVAAEGSDEKTEEVVN